MLTVPFYHYHCQRYHISLISIESEISLFLLPVFALVLKRH